ncbi:hypothetical protein AAMO2058_000494500 [Amorphochlora amoebiformis]
MGCSPSKRNRKCVRVVDIDGRTPQEKGRQHGEFLRKQIHECWKFYLDLFHRVGWKDAEIRQAAMDIRGCIQRFFPAYVQEMKALADSAGLEEWQVIALNSRTEILNARRTAPGWTAEKKKEIQRCLHNIQESKETHADGDKEEGECTAIFLKKDAIQAQNWDWEEKLEGLFTVLRYSYPDGRKFIMLTEPGIIGKIGLNSSGLGTCLNLVSHTHTCALWGGIERVSFTPCIPVHILLRVALDSTEFKRALDTVKKAPRCCASMSNIMLGHSSGKSAMIELGGKSVEVFFGENQMHTNHFLGCGFDKITTGSASSYARYTRCTHLLRELDDSVDGELEAKRILSDGEGKLPILRPYCPSLELGLQSGGTCCTIVLHLRKGILEVTSGSPLSHPYHKICLANEK